MDTITTTVTPGTAVCGERIKLGAIDQIAPRGYSPLLTFFRLPPSARPSHIFRTLQEGVYNATREIPQVLCQVHKCNNDREELELLWDSASGASITLKDYTSPGLKNQWPNVSFDDLERDHFPLARMPRKLVLGLNDEDGEFLPSLVIQANFIRGGLILSVCLHHLLCDGPSIYNFVKALAKHTRAASLGLDAACLPDVDYMDRSTAVSPDTRVSLEEFPDWKLVAGGESFLNPTSYQPELLPIVKYATYFISETNIRRLREKLTQGQHGRPSLIEAVGAFAWRHVILARKIDPVKYPEAKLSVTVDTRARMANPVVSPTYWGNLCEPNAVARMPTARLCETSRSSEYEVLPEAASQIKRAIAAVDNTAVRRLVGLLNQMPKSTSLTWNVDRWPGPDMLIVCLNKHLFNHLDFGAELGCSEACRFTVGDTEGKPDGRCLVMPARTRDGKGLEIMLQYDVDTLERLKQSEAFAEYFEWRH